ncbi:MAG: hypothetical protein A2Y17_09995 [Clostridiales bacterium GWF2_38_85]|nr:MAG: hypothetical protein A2Y17_09995 [Clostridiales bacterium GWF2_38_85]HBL84448.1 hypothetical protein [Clostridiales bacterium]
MIPYDGINRIFGMTPCYAVDIIVNENNIGSISNSVFQLNDINQPSYQEIYCYLRENHRDFLNEYNEINKADKTSTAITRPFNDFSGEDEFDTGIVSYDINLMKYIGISFDEDILTEEQIQTMAESIKLSEAEN